MRILPNPALFLAIAALGPTAATAAAQGPEIIHAFTTYGVDIGGGGFAVSNAAGLDEIYMNAHTPSFNSVSFWHALSYDPVEDTYLQSYVSAPYPAEVLHLAVADAHANPGDELLVVLENGDIHILDQVTKEQLGLLVTGVDQLTAFDLLDIDADGLVEFAMVGSTGLSLVESDGLTFANYPSLSGLDVIIGQMDADAGFEVAVTDGSVLDITSGLVQCSYPSGFGIALGLSDFDGDGMEELIYAERWNFTHAVDVDTCSTQWSLPQFNTDAILIGDSDQDGIEELIVGEAQWGDIVSYDLNTQAVHWSIDNPQHGVSNLLLVDADQDGQTEVVWGAGQTSSGQDNLFVGDIALQDVEWENIDFTGPFHGPLLGDVDGDGVDEIVTASFETNSGLDGGRIVVLEADTFEPVIHTEILRGNEIEDISLADLDGDGDMEILACGTYWIQGFDFLSNRTLDQVWEFGQYASNPEFASVDAYDLDGDGVLEIVAGTFADSNGNGYVYVFDHATRLEDWHSLPMGVLGDDVTDMEFGDFDGDGLIEIAVLLESNSIYVFAADSTLEAIIPGDFQTLQMGPDVPGQARRLIAGTRSGALEVYQYNGLTYQLAVGLPLVSTFVEGFQLMGTSFVLLGTEGIVHAFRIQGGALVWQSPDFGELFGKEFVILPNGDFVTSGSSGVYVYGFR